MISNTVYIEPPVEKNNRKPAVNRVTGKSVDKEIEQQVEKATEKQDRWKNQPKK